MFNKQYSLAQLKESSAERKPDICNTTCNKLTNQVKETCVRAMEPKTLVSHQLLSLVLQDTSLGGKTASMLKKPESNERQPGCSHTFPTVTRHLGARHTSPRLPAQLFVTFSTTSSYSEHTHAGNWKKRGKGKRRL